jgi:ribosomal protein S18 acetylase RimI-like enzyme
MEDPLPLLRRATESDWDIIIQLIDEAAEWLRTKNTDQWRQPWPSAEDRKHRILRDLRAERTWIASDRGAPFGTVTADPEENPVWPKETRHDQAIYACRLVVARTHGGLGLGAALLDWVGLRGRRRDGARWVRVDVWTTNRALHAYYERQGFEFYGVSDEVDGYPSAALFQKPTDLIVPPSRPLFRVSP